MSPSLDAVRAMWDERYAAEPFAYGTEPNTYFAEKLARLATGKLLLPAEGEGRNAAFALGSGWDVEAFDLSEAGKSKAVRLASGLPGKLTYRVGDVRTMHFPEATFDAVAFVYAHFPSAVRDEVFPRFVRAVRPGGHVIAEVFGKHQLAYQSHHASGGPREADLLCSVEDLRRLFVECDVLELLEGEVFLEEGLHHRGLGWVCRFFGVKRPEGGSSA